MISLNSSFTNRRLFRSATMVHCLVYGCLSFSVRQGTRMLHWGHHGWGRFTPSKVTTVYRTCRCRKCTRIAVLVADCPGHPSTSQLPRHPLSGKAMQYVRGSSPVAEFFQIYLSSAARPLCVILCPTKDSAAISSPHYLHYTRTFCRSR